MGMLAAIVNVNVLQQLGAKAILGKHALDHLDEQRVHAGLDALLVRLLHQNLRSSKTLATGIARVANILLVGPLLAGENDLVSVDDDHIVATVHMRSEAGLVLAAQDLRDLAAQATQNLIGSIDNYPFFLDGFGLSRDGFVT